jgi:protein SCO1
MKPCALLLIVASALAGRVRADAPADVRYEQRIGQPLPMGALFTDESGRTRPLGSFFGNKPAVLYFNYFNCPQLCSLVSAGTVDVLRQVESSIGKDYTVVSVSIDPTDTVPMALSHQRQEVLHYGRSGASGGWHTLVGGPAAIRELAIAAGFHYAYDPRSRQYAHPSGLLVVTPQGVVSSYFLGVDFPARQVASALRLASENKTGRSVFSLLFICFEGGSPQGEYGRLIWIILSVSVALTVGGVFGGIAWMLRAEHLARSRTEGAA